MASRGKRYDRIALRALAFMALLWAALWPPIAQADEDYERVARWSETLIVGDALEFDGALAFFRDRGTPDAAAAAILALRFRDSGAAHQIADLLTELTGHQARDWHDWMLWQEAHPEILPHPSYANLSVRILELIDPNFRAFFEAPWLEPQRMTIRVEEIAWGGVPALTGIPSLDDPKLIPGSEADYLLDEDLVFGVEIAGDARAYPLRIMGWHEMFNDVIGGVPLALAYCTLCGSGILYETAIEGFDAPLRFGSSGLLYRSNKLMFDWQTKSLWNQFTGRPVVGPLVESGIELKTRPLAITSWADWRARHPQTKVLSLETGYSRDYGSGVVYRAYFSSPELMFPATVPSDARLAPKDYVFGLRLGSQAKAWPLAAFAGGRVIADKLGEQDLVLIGDAATRTVRAYESAGAIFAAEARPERLIDTGGAIWEMTEDHLIAPDGRKLARLAGQVSYWFAWANYFGAESELYEEGE